MGVESGAQHVLDAMDKGTTLDEVREGTRRLKQHGIHGVRLISLDTVWSAMRFRAGAE